MWVIVYLFLVVWQVGKQHEIEEAGHNPQILAQHGILLDTNLHQDPSPQSGENKRWETKWKQSEVFPLSFMQSQEGQITDYSDKVKSNYFHFQVPSSAVHKAHLCRGNLLLGADRTKRGNRFRGREHQGAVEVGAGAHGDREAGL